MTPVRTRRRVIRPISEQVVVITGASSGIGRETAVHFARHGSSVVLAARNEQALRAAAVEVEQAGGVALVVPTDVADWTQVQALAAAAVHRFGRIDTWVNNAVVASFGPFIDTPVEVIDQVLQVGLRGQVYGAKAVLPIMREQGRGTLIGVSSAFGIRSVPLFVAYSIAKHGNTALYEGLRVEEQVTRSGIEVSMVLPATVNTPFYEVAPSTMGTRPPMTPPVYQPEVVARAIVHLAGRPSRHVFIGVAGPLYAMQRLSPRAVDAVVRTAARVFLRHRTQPVDAGQSNHLRPIPGDGSRLGSARIALPRSRYTRTVGFHPAAACAVAASVLLLASRRLARRWS